MRTAALFDLDGVLVDTESSYTEFWTLVGKTYFPENVQFAQSIKGQTLANIYADHFADRPDWQEAVMRELDSFEQSMGYPYVPGAMDFVRQLRERGVGVAVVTSSNCKKMENLYREHPEFPAAFDRIFTAEDALRSKPAPDCYIAAAQHFGLSAASCVVFEDSFNGLRSGRASGAKVVGLATSHPASVIRDYADEVVADFQDAEKLLHWFD